jgi:hypothetical protein
VGRKRQLRRRLKSKPPRQWPNSKATRRRKISIPFVVMIGAERWTVILDKALEGAIEAPSAVPDISDSDLYRTDAALKSGAAMLIELRNRICSRGLLTGDACTLPEFPAWTREACRTPPPRSPNSISAARGSAR